MSIRGQIIKLATRLLLAILWSLFTLAHVSHAEPILIGLDADMSSGSARSGEAIRRGIVLAMHEINSSGGVLGRPLKLVIRDHRGNPARGLDNIEAFAQTEHLVAVVGGLHTPVALAELPIIHQHQIIFLVPWAAGTPVVVNGYKPNFVFRVSVRDEYAGKFLVDQAILKGYQRPGLLLEQTGWGRSNERAMKTALQAHGLTPAGIEWFHWGTEDMADLIASLASADTDVIMLVANAPEGIKVVQAMAQLPAAQRLPIISHWGITGGDFFTQTRASLSEVDLVFLQTCSFLQPTFPNRARPIVATYCRLFPDCQSAQNIFAPAGTAHAYDLIHLLKLAIEKAGTTNRIAVRQALEHLDLYSGLIRDYQPPFTPENHDALSAADFRLASYNQDGHIIPLNKSK